MKGPESRKARPLTERLADLDARISKMEVEARSVTPGEHTVADLLNDLRGRCDDLRARVNGAQNEPGAEAHHAARGTGATSASRKDLSDRDHETSGNEDLEASFRDLEDSYNRLNRAAD